MQRTPNTVEETARGGLGLHQVLATKKTEMLASPGGLPTRDHEQHGGGTLFGALVLCIKPISSRPVPHTSIVSYKTNYG